ncbi:MAG: gamma-glutamyltransferase family protein [Ardenticatenaceae bacterium]
MSGVIAGGGADTVAAGAAMLKKGGNAVDAAVAAAFASFTSEVGLVHLGGSGVAHIFDSQQGESFVYDFFSNMPGLGLKMPLSIDFHQVTIDFGSTTQDFYLGRAAVAVPGNIAGLCQMATDYSRLPLATLLEPAIELARQGVSIAPFQAATCKLLTPLYTHSPPMSQIFAPHGHIIPPGEHLFIPHLADTLTALAKEGAELARTGHLAQAILADQAAHGGLLTPTDLQEYQVRRLAPIRIPYREYEILLPPPSSVGGVLIAFTLKLLGDFDLTQYPHGSANHLRLLYEVMSATTRARVYWDRISEELPADQAIRSFLADHFVQPYRHEVQAALKRKQPTPSAPEPRSPNNTSHISVIDSDGLMVSLTTTAGESAGYVVPGTGYIPNNMLGEEDLHPHGFHTRPPGQRIPTMMTPTIVLKDGQPTLVIGSGGSIRIRSAILQVLSNLLDYQMNLDYAVNAPRVHVQNGVLQCEKGYHAAAVNEIEPLGYPVNRWNKRSLYFGGAHSTARMPDGQLVAAGDSRRGGEIALAY